MSSTARRTLAIAAPVVYVVALAVVVATWGLPLARDQLFFWLGLGMAAFSITAWRSWGRMLVDWLPFYGLLVGYDFLRGAVQVAPRQASVAPQIDLDRFLFGGEGPTVWLQGHLWHPGHLHVWDYLTWGTYMTHFFAVWIVAAVLWARAREHFRRYAALTVTVTLGAFLTYWLYPAQPPWLAARDHLLPPVDRIVPVVWGHVGVKSIASLYEDDRLVNTVAAMPSLHAAFPVMLLLFFWGAGRRVRALLATYALAMAFALVYSGEHFATDVLAGWALSGLSFTVVTLVARAAAGHALVLPGRRPRAGAEAARGTAAVSPPVARG